LALGLWDYKLQTFETTRQLSEVDRELIKEVLKQIFARRMAGDIDGMLEYLSPDVVCFPETSWGHARYSRKIVGKEAVKEAFKQRHINFVNLGSVVHRILIDGDQAAVHRTTSIRERGSDVAYTFDSVDFFKFRDGLVVEFCELPDGTAYDAVINFPH
jgi:ketosteroid isomerase-like protein